MAVFQSFGGIVLYIVGSVDLFQIGDILMVSHFKFIILQYRKEEFTDSSFELLVNAISQEKAQNHIVF
ncbi:hypothetical protein SAMN05421846_10990 [Chryseobacterium taeanense]|uniref:Uncharacterized protein n=1 Tax=Chryseobacterium taeanense TaxID=311334 RepID=A0A1G8LFR0_9FLAO|nr:hypothetical protein SAMN05421846_10990 [Chryseobacterium taeanense]